MRGTTCMREYRREDIAGRYARKRRRPRRELAKVLAEQPGFYAPKEQSIRAVRARVEWVRASRLHDQYLRVRKLILSGNHIDELSWLRHFACVEFLSLEANQVADTRELRWLAHASRLTHLRLAENPVAQSPFFAAHVKVCAPRLAELDCVPALELGRAREEVHFDISTQSILVEDLCELLSLRLVAQICRVHAELVQCTVRYPSLSALRKVKRLARHNNCWQFRDLAKDAVDDVTVVRLTSGNLETLLRLWQFSERLDAEGIAEVQAEVVRRTVSSVFAQMHRRCGRQPRGSHERWETRAYDEVSKEIRADISRLLLALDDQRELDQEWLNARPRLGPETATRHAAELEAERAYERYAESAAAHKDVQWIRARMRAHATPPSPPSSARKVQTPLRRSPLPSPAISMSASMASAGRSYFGDMESYSESLYLASERLLDATECLDTL